MSGLPEGAATSLVPPSAPVNIVVLLGFSVVVAGLGGLFFMTTGRRRRGSASAGDLRAMAVTVEPAALRPRPATGPSYAAPSAPSDEANVPRWLRASVRAERFETFDRSVRATASLAIRRGARFSEPPLESATRMLVRYERVEVLEQPHEAYGRPLTEVGTNDEVDVLEAQGAWALIRTPSGVTGWLPTMALDRPATAPAAEGTDPEPPAAAATADAVSEPRRARRRGRPATR